MKRNMSMMGIQGKGISVSNVASTHGTLCFMDDLKKLSKVILDNWHFTF